MRLEYFDMIDTVVTFDPSQKRIVTRSTVPRRQARSSKDISPATRWCPACC